MPMNQEIKARWVAWLHEHADKQTNGRLHRTSTNDSDNAPVGFCCLGGLCELAVADGIIEAREEVHLGQSLVAYGKETDRLDDRNSAVLPRIVMEWAGLEDSDPEVVVPEDEASKASTLGLTTVNDDLRLNFHQIADLIDAQL